MAVENDADRLVFFNTDEFGVAVIKGTDTFNGVFDNDLDEELNITSESAVLAVRTADVSAYTIAIDNTLTIDSASYKVREVLPDNTGVHHLVLEKQ